MKNFKTGFATLLAMFVVLVLSIIGSIVVSSSIGVLTTVDPFVSRLESYAVGWQAIDQAIIKYGANPIAWFDTDHIADAFYYSNPLTFQVNHVNWSAVPNATISLPNYTLQYVVVRLCMSTGRISGTRCQGRYAGTVGSNVLFSQPFMIATRIGYTSLGEVHYYFHDYFFHLNFSIPPETL